MAAKVALEPKRLGTQCQLLFFCPAGSVWHYKAWAPNVKYLVLPCNKLLCRLCEQQPRSNLGRLPPMVSEFAEIRQRPSRLPRPSFSRPFGTHSAGVHVATATEAKPSEFVSIGIQKTPEEFVEAALEISHPTHVRSFFPESMHKIVQRSVPTSHATLA